MLHCYKNKHISPCVLFSRKPNTMINTVFVNNPCRRQAGNLSQYSTETKLLFKPVQYFEALIFLMLLIFVGDLSSYNISEGPFNGKSPRVSVIILKRLKGDDYNVKCPFCYKLNEVILEHYLCHQPSPDLYEHSSNIFLGDAIICANGKNIKNLFFQWTYHIPHFGMEPLTCSLVNCGSIL